MRRVDSFLQGHLVRLAYILYFIANSIILGSI